MNFKNLLALALALPLIACQSRTAKNSADDNPFQCISATIMVAGKPTTTVLEWNTKTGMARILDSMVVTSKATGAQNILIGWVPLGDLQGALQEIVSRNQALQQQTPASPQNAAPAPTQENPSAPTISTASGKKKK